MANNRRSHPEVDIEMRKLLDLRSKIPQKDFFGGNNLTKIDAQIAVLRDRMTIPRIEQIYGDHSEGMDDSYEPEIQNEAMEAYNWMVGQSDLSPAESWGELVTLKPLI